MFCILLMVALMFTWLWPLSALYFIWLVVDWETPERGEQTGQKKYYYYYSSSSSSAMSI